MREKELYFMYSADNLNEARSLLDTEIEEQAISVVDVDYRVTFDDNDDKVYNFLVLHFEGDLVQASPFYPT